MRTDNLVWSPTKNEFVSYSGCRGSKTAIYFTNMLNSERIDITPENLLCYVTFLWHPSGNYFLFSAESLEEERLGEIVGWQVDPSSLTLNELEEPDYFWGWLNNELRVSERRIGTGINSIGITNMITEERVSGTAFEGNAQSVSQNYVLLNEEYATSYNTYVAVLDQKEISPELLHFGGKYIKFLGKNLGEAWEHLFYSRFMDVLPNSDQVLVLTWQELVFDLYEITDVLTGVVPTNLQMWDINSDELTLIREGGIYGRFSPSGNELVILTATSNSPQLELLNRVSNETIITQPAYAETDEYTVDVFAFTSFSPNGRFLTYYSPEQELIIYDIVLGTFLPSITAVPITPVWSPDNGRFVYQDRNNGLSIYQIEPNTTYALTQAGCDELRNPQWSFDGSYLSVDIPCAGTAVLQLP